MANFHTRAENPTNRFSLELRERGYTNTEIATLLDISSTTISRWCHKERKWNKRQRARLSYHLKVPQLVLDQWWHDEVDEEDVIAAADYGLKERKRRAHRSPDDDGAAGAGQNGPATGPDPAWPVTARGRR